MPNSDVIRRTINLPENPDIPGFSSPRLRASVNHNGEETGGKDSFCGRKKTKKTSHLSESILRREPKELLMAALNRCPNIDARKPRNLDPPLVMAAALNNEDMVRILLEHGAQVDVKGHCECTPLYEAVRNMNTGVVATLLSHGASPYAKGQFGGTPMRVAEVAARHSENPAAGNVLQLLQNAVAAAEATAIKVGGRTSGMFMSPPPEQEK